MQGEHAEEIVARIKAKEKESKPRPDKSTKRTPEQSFQSKKKDTLMTKTTYLLSPGQLEGVKNYFTDSLLYQDSIETDENPHPEEHESGNEAIQSQKKKSVSGK